MASITVARGEHVPPTHMWHFSGIGKLLKIYTIEFVYRSRQSQLTIGFVLATKIIFICTCSFEWRNVDMTCKHPTVSTEYILPAFYHQPPPPPKSTHIITEKRTRKEATCRLDKHFN